MSPRCRFWTQNAVSKGKKKKKKSFWAGPWRGGKKKRKNKKEIFNSVSFGINILHAPLANIFVVLLKTHKTAVCSPKGWEAAVRGAKEERGFIPISSSLRKPLWKMMIFLRYPTAPSGFCCWNAQKVFLSKSRYQKSSRPFWRKYVVFKIICYSVRLLFWHDRE